MVAAILSINMYINSSLDEELGIKIYGSIQIFKSKIFEFFLANKKVMAKII